ncbi:hypothetical protein Pelo_17714 [Pelomyxa schiedti]|nr:hypothetical protein Pelo_17714 [Pelomyxa schiedti]
MHIVPLYSLHFKAGIPINPISAPQESLVLALSEDYITYKPEDISVPISQLSYEHFYDSLLMAKVAKPAVVTAPSLCSLSDLECLELIVAELEFAFPFLPKCLKLDKVVGVEATFNTTGLLRKCLFISALPMLLCSDFHIGAPWVIQQNKSWP